MLHEVGQIRRYYTKLAWLVTPNDSPETPRIGLSGVEGAARLPNHRGRFMTTRLPPLIGMASPVASHPSAPDLFNILARVLNQHTCDVRAY
jgi:hypothetical protein